MPERLPSLPWRNVEHVLSTPLTSDQLSMENLQGGEAVHNFKPCDFISFTDRSPTPREVSAAHRKPKLIE